MYGEPPMHLRLEKFDSLEISRTLFKFQADFFEEIKISLSACNLRRIPLEEWDYAIFDILSVLHFVTIAERMILPPVSLDVDAAASKKSVQFVEDVLVLVAKFQAEFHFNLGSSP